ncbi:hypothetical protein BH11PLA2_BH11PLA2_51110 [soil metagenome]
MNGVNRHSLACDILIAGGGPAGTVAALAAARRGATVILCQDRPVLGGNASSEVRMHVVGADQSGFRSIPLATEAREGGIIEEIRLENSVRNPQRSASMYDLILYDLCRSEPNLTLLLNTTVVDAHVEGHRIGSVSADRNSTEDRFQIRAEVFVDATGDGGLGAAASAEFMEGRESNTRFGESLGQPEHDAMRLGSTLLFQARRHDTPMPFTAPAWARKFTEADLRLRPHGGGGDFGDLGLEYGYWWVEWGGHLDTIRDNETIRDELLAILLGVWDHVKNGGDHSAANWALDWMGFLPGKRESRRFTGQYVLTQQDVQQSTPFADAIAYGGWFIDTHPPRGVDATGEEPCSHHVVPYLYDIPLRCCVSRSLSNLMFAGRNISATHLAFASTRVMATCAVIGQGVGTAAAYAVTNGIAPASLTADDNAMTAIRRHLLEDDAFLIDGPSLASNLMATVTISASSEQADGPASNVISRQTRSVHGVGGVMADRSHPGTHRWMSAPSQGFPAWIELRWPMPVAAKRMQLIFDTGLHRPLTLTHAEAYARKMIWGRGQPETVRDYTIETCANGAWRTQATRTGNSQRLNRLVLNDAPFEAVRIVVHATNGLDHARICGIHLF